MALRDLPRGIAQAGWSAPVYPVDVPFVTRLIPAVKPRLLVGAGLAVVVAVTATFELLRAQGIETLGLVMVVTMLAAPLVVVLVAPLLTWRIMTVALFASTLLVPPATNLWPWPLSGFAAYLLVTLLVSLIVERTTLLGVAVLACVFPVLPAGPQDRMPDGVVFLIFALVILVVSVGGLVRETVLTRRALDDEIVRGEAEVVRATALAERARLARELHDVVAHHMSLIAIQSDVAPRAIPDLPPAAVEAFGTIRTSSTTALAEMRRIVDTLREADAGAERAPLPTLDDLPTLVESVRATGATVRYDAEDHLPVPPAPVAVSVYRIAQEALANAVQHAPGGEIEVSLRAERGALRLTVRNGGPGAGAADPGRTDTPARRRRGLGLVGMRERAHLLGGTVVSGPTPSGGFEVMATIPIAVGHMREKEEA